MNAVDLPRDEIQKLAEVCTQIHVSGVDFPAIHLKALDAHYEDVISEALLKTREPTWSEVRLERKLHEAERRAEV